MPITGTSTDYSNRTKDLHILQGVSPTQKKAINLKFGRFSSYCSGVQKLIQRYTIALLTELGSQVNFNTFGSSLLAELKGLNTTAAQAEVKHIFNFASSKVTTDFRNYQKELEAAVPEDEQLGTAILESVNYENDILYLAIRIYPISGDETAFIIPLPLAS